MQTNADRKWFMTFFPQERTERNIQTRQKKKHIIKNPFPSRI